MSVIYNNNTVRPVERQIAFKLAVLIIAYTEVSARCRMLSYQYNSTGFCSSQLNDFSSLYDAADTQLFTEILHNPCHVLQALLTPPADHNYNLRDRPHNRQLPDRMSHLTNCNFIVRMLFCESY